MAQKRKFSLEASRMLKRKSSELFRSLPKVPTTQYLEHSELTCDILYSGYRPVVYPVRETPLGHRNVPAGKLRKTPSEFLSSSSGISASSMAGVSGSGGIGSGGVNGTWRHNPRIPSRLLPYNLWSSSSMAMEYYPEWLGVPRSVVYGLRPFERPQLQERRKGAVAAEPAKARSSVTGAKFRRSDKLSRQVDQFMRYLREKDGN
ncbi:LAFA_0D06656g1_1 [Lachancea sp. 'fantastica']|nr:LAFA_0D06656g1_1 [Lachancea sp. 'fantastica']